VLDPVNDGLSIGDLARRTGVPAATLRSWEDRYGFPRPQRLDGGHRRYREADTAGIEQILRLRASGMSLQAAIDQAARGTGGDRSLFAGLRRRHPALVPTALRKATLLALTRAIEDECLARAERAVLFAGFQAERFYRSSRQRTRELARAARVMVVFADFGRSSGPGASPLTVRLPDDSPLRREWFLVCAAPDYPAFVSGWELPPERAGAERSGAERAGAERADADAQRRFEVLWSVDPQAVQDAASICAGLTRSLAPGLDRALGDLPAGSPPPASADLQRATGLFNRMASYLDRR
jgi:DNA-binding transcriptional MerR regulator